jgi:hypothetical protein
VTGAPHQALLWSRILHIAESMEDPQISLEQLRGQLCALDEGFAGVFDPAEQFPEFVAHRLCRSMERLLAGLDTIALSGRRA